MDRHRWISLIDDDGEAWLFDMSFLATNYQCIYGQGCPSIAPEPDPTGSLGCCTHGAHLADEDDLQRVGAAASRLDSSTWQFYGRAQAKGGPFKKNTEGDWLTRIVDGACIFLNRPEFPGGPGCALHQGAQSHGERPLDWKPDVCWQVPIRLDIHTDEFGRDTMFVKAWQRHDWGDGGQEFHWWCIEEPEAYSSTDPVYLSHRDELLELIGPDLYRRLCAELDEITQQSSTEAGTSVVLSKGVAR